MDRRRTLSALVALVVIVGAGIVALTSRGNTGASERVETGRGTSVADAAAPSLLAAAPRTRSRASDRSDQREAEADPGDAASATDEEKTVLGNATLEGIVVDESGRPVEGAHIEVAPFGSAKPTIEGGVVRSSWTGADGRFVVTGLLAGDTFLSAEGPGSADEMSRTQEDVRLSLPARDVRLVLVRLGSAKLRVLRPDGTAFVGSADWVSNGYQGSGAQVETKDGVFGQYGLEDADYEFRVTVKGFAPIRKPFRGQLGRVVHLGDVVLDPGVTLRGRVADGAGVPVSGARVSVDLVPAVASDGRGAFALEHVQRGPVDLTVQADGFLRHHAHLDAAEVAGDVAVTLSRGGVVYGTLRNSGGQSQGSVALSAIPLDVDGGPAVTDPIRITTPSSAPAGLRPPGFMDWRLPAGRWRIIWQRPATERDREEDVTLAEWTVCEGESKQIDLTLPAR